MSRKFTGAVDKTAYCGSQTAAETIKGFREDMDIVAADRPAEKTNKKTGRSRRRLLGFVLSGNHLSWLSLRMASTKTNKQKKNPSI